MSNNSYCIDLDSTNTSIYKSRYGLVLSEPTVAAVDESDGGKVKAIGNDAKKLIGKTSKTTKIVFPVFEGEIVNEKVCASVLQGFLEKTEFKSGGSVALFSVPCGANYGLIEKYKNVSKSVGIKKVYFVEAPFLSALGQRIPFNEAAPCFVVDISGGVTNVAVLSMDGIIAGVSINLGGNKITTNIIDYISEKFSLQIGLLTAERLKKEIGSLDKFDELTTIVNGRDTISGTPKSLVIKASDIYQQVKSVYDTIAELALSVLKKVPPEVSAEIRHSGVYLSGSASEIYNLKNYYKDIFKMNVNIAENSSMAVALGGGIALGDSKILKKIELKSK